jgi:ubiquitin-conjugating enzyme E2 variant
MIIVFVKILLAILAADFLTGLVHWWEDAYGNPNWKFLGKAVIEPNLLHHQKPREFLKSSYYQLVFFSVLVGLGLIALSYVLGILNYYTAFAILLSTQGNQIHAFAHQSNRENGPIICFLQELGVLQSRKHHGYHHRAPYECHYCAITNYLNPLLDRIRFWTALEWLILKISGKGVLRGNEIRKGL